MNILITGAWQDAQQHIAEIENMGHEVCFMQYEKDELPYEYGWVEGVICNGLFLYHEIEKFINLKYIQLTSAGYDRVPMDYVKKHGIEAHNAKGVYSIPMAEFAIAGVLELYKQRAFFRENQKVHKWEKHRGLLELYGKKVCIVGCGSVGNYGDIAVTLCEGADNPVFHTAVDDHHVVFVVRRAGETSFRAAGQFRPVRIGLFCLYQGKGFFVGGFLIYDGGFHPALFADYSGEHSCVHTCNAGYASVFQLF